MRSLTSCNIVSSLTSLVVLSPSTYGFSCSNLAKKSCLSSYATSTATSSLCYSNWDDAFETQDAFELMVGGTLYEMVKLPDSMVSTTLWVGNLGEFVTDDVLSQTFQQASTLRFVPACVVRKPNMESLRYGFVTFRSEEEKEIALELLHGYELQGKYLKVEPIRDHEKSGRVRAPQKIVDYCVGPIKRQRNGELNTMRRATANCDVDDDEDRVGKYRLNRAQHKAGMEKRKTRGQYKNQQRKHSRATRAPFI